MIHVFVGSVAVASPADFSFISLFFKADIIVKFVMISLALASLWCWAIVIDKWFALALLRKRARQFEEVFWSGRSLTQLHDELARPPKEPLARIFAAAMREWHESSGKEGETTNTDIFGTRERVDRAMSLVISQELSKADNGLGILGTVGSVAPFIGLLGTVWGIMNSFRAIAVSQNTNLTVVAPGIAEALFATALGLFAAIPAVIFYNKFSSDLARYAVRLEGFADEMSAVVSRRLGEGENS